MRYRARSAPVRPDVPLAKAFCILRLCKLVRQLAGVVGQYTPFHLYHGRVLASEFFNQVEGGLLRIDQIPAGEYVHRRIRVFWPGMDTEMGFGYYNHAAYPKRAELVEGNVNYGCRCLSGSLDKRILYQLEVAEHLGIAISQIYQEVLAQCIQFSTPLPEFLDIAEIGSFEIVKLQHLVPLCQEFFKSIREKFSRAILTAFHSGGMFIEKSYLFLIKKQTASAFLCYYVSVKRAKASAWKSILPAAAFLLAVALPVPSHAIGVSQPAPEIALKDNSGKLVSLTGLRGKIVVVNFWATWCTGCVQELPQLSGFYDKYQGRNVVVLGITEDSPGEVKALSRTVRISYPILFDTAAKAHRSFEASPLPVTFIIDRTGVIREKIFGSVTEKRLEAAVQKLF